MLICNTNRATSDFYTLEQNSSDFEQFSSFKCIQTANSRFFMQNEIMQDCAKFQYFISKAHDILMFLKISSL